MRWLTGVVFLGVILSLVVSPAWAAEMRPEQIVRQYGRAVVMVTVADSSHEQGFGTGFIVSPDGLVVTNYHVIRDAARASIRLTNGRQFSVLQIVATDKARDLALLRVSARGLPTVRLGNAGSLGVGSRVYVIGNPEGLQNTLSDGLLSGKRRLDSLQLLQITAPISEGSSGSPVFDAYGRVIGVATASHRTGQNLNLAVPVSYARSLIQSSRSRVARAPKPGLARRAAPAAASRSRYARYADSIQRFCPELSRYTAELLSTGVVVCAEEHKLDGYLLLAVLQTEGLLDRIEWRGGKYYIGRQSVYHAFVRVAKDLATSLSLEPPPWSWANVAGTLSWRRSGTHPEESLAERQIYLRAVGRLYYELARQPLPEELQVPDAEFLQPDGRTTEDAGSDGDAEEQEEGKPGSQRAESDAERARILKIYADGIQHFSPRLKAEAAELLARMATSTGVSHRIDPRLLIAVLAMEKVFDQVDWRNGTAYIGSQAAATVLDAACRDLAQRLHSKGVGEATAPEWDALSQALTLRRNGTHPSESVEGTASYVKNVARLYYPMCGRSLPSELEQPVNRE